MNDITKTLNSEKKRLKKEIKSLEKKINIKEIELNHLSENLIMFKAALHGIEKALVETKKE